MRFAATRQRKIFKEMEKAGVSSARLGHRYM
jgi:hypothetical protein